jgi:hypothetical protein
VGLREFIHARARQIQLVLVCLIGAGIATSSVIYFNTPPQPHHQSRIGNVTFDLKQFDYRLTYEDLQSVGLFAGMRCGKCEFGRGGKTVTLDDFHDPSFMASLLRFNNERFLHVTFYSADASVGRQRFDAVARALRARFPGRGKAIRMFRGERGNEEITAE